MEILYLSHGDITSMKMLYTMEILYLPATSSYPNSFKVARVVNMKLGFMD